MRTPEEIYPELNALYLDYADYTKPPEKLPFSETMKKWFLGSTKETKESNLKFSQGVEKLTAELMECLEAEEDMEVKRRIAFKTCEMIMDREVRKKDADDRDLYVAAMMINGEKFYPYLTEDGAAVLLEYIKRLPTLYMMPAQRRMKETLSQIAGVGKKKK